MSYARCTVFSQAGVALADLEPEIESVSWRQNGVGMAKLTLPWTDPKCTASNLALGNRVLLRFDNGLPDWGGVIDVPRRRVVGAVGVTAYSGERLLSWRRTPQGRYFSSKTPGYIANALLTEENAEAPTGLLSGNIYTGGTARTLEYHYHDLLARFQDLARLTGEVFYVRPALEGGGLRLYLDWLERRGYDKSADIWLQDGANVVDAVLDEQGPLNNTIILVGEGTTWGADRLVSRETDVSSAGAYGVREYAEVQSGVVVQGTLDANAAELLAEQKDPANAISVTVSDDEPGRFEDYDVGDTVQASLFVDSSEWRFEAPVLVLAREWTPAGTCRLEIQEAR